MSPDYVVRGVTQLRAALADIAVLCAACDQPMPPGTPLVITPAIAAAPFTHERCPPRWTPVVHTGNRTHPPPARPLPFLYPVPDPTEENPNR